MIFGNIMFAISILTSALLLTETVAGQYVLPQALVEPLYPRGVRISVPHQTGMTRVHFDMKLNEIFYGNESGTIVSTQLDSGSIRAGTWSYENRKTRLWKGDILYYQIHVVRQGHVYNLLNQQYEVTEFYDISGDLTNWPCAYTESKIFDATTRRNKNVCSGHLLMDDQFDQLNETLWTQIERFTGSPDYAFVVYRNDRRNINVAHGKLNIVPISMVWEFGEHFIHHGTIVLEKCTAEHGSQDCRRSARGSYILPPVISGSMYTKNSFAFTYGVVEVRAKLPLGDWIYPVIALEPLETSSSSSTSQLRVASSFGNTDLQCGRIGNDFSGRMLFGGAFEFDNSTDGSTSMPGKYSQTLWSNDYHLYELEWRPDRIVSRVDGEVYGNTKSVSPFDGPFYVKLGVAVGGHVEFSDSCMSNGHAKPWRNVEAKVDTEMQNVPPPSPAQLVTKTSVFSFYKAKVQWIQHFTNLQIDYIRVWAL